MANATAVPAAVRIAGMLAIGSAAIAEMLSLRRVHSPAASSASANSAAEQGAHAGAEQAGLDRIADHEETAERQRQAADPDHPAGADAFLEAGTGLRQRRRRRRGAADGVARRGILIRRERGGRFSIVDRGRLFGRDIRRSDRGRLLKLIVWRSGGGADPSVQALLAQVLPARALPAMRSLPAPQAARATLT